MQKKEKFFYSDGSFCTMDPISEKLEDAVLKQDIKEIKTLLVKGAHPDSEIYEVFIERFLLRSLNHVITLAACLGQKDIVILLLHYGADISLKTNYLTIKQIVENYYEAEKKYIHSEKQLKLKEIIQLLFEEEKKISIKNQLIDFLEKTIPNLQKGSEKLESITLLNTHIKESKNTEKLAYQIARAENILSLHSMEGIIGFLKGNWFLKPKNSRAFLKLFKKENLGNTLVSDYEFYKILPEPLKIEILFNFDEIKPGHDEKITCHKIINLANSLIENNQELYIKLFLRYDQVFSLADLTQILSMSYLSIFMSSEHNEIFHHVLNRVITEYQQKNIDPLHVLLQKMKEVNLIKFLNQQKDEHPFIFLLDECRSLMLSKTLPCLCSNLINIIKDYSYYPHRLFINDFKTLELFKENPQFAYYMPAAGIQQDGINDCGYWTLFNSFLTLSGFSAGEKEWYWQLKNRNFDRQIKMRFQDFQNLLDTKLFKLNKKDLTALDLDFVFDSVYSEKFLLDEIFPNLTKTLTTIKKVSDIPLYTIVNTEIPDEKKELGFVLGGNLPQLKLQIAINFYILSQHKYERIFHFIFVGFAGHWHVELLIFSCLAPGSIDSISIDSNPINNVNVTRFNVHLRNILLNPIAYAEVLQMRSSLKLESTLIQLLKNLKKVFGLNHLKKNKLYNIVDLWCTSFQFSLS